MPNLKFKISGDDNNYFLGKSMWVTNIFYVTLVLKLILKVLAGSFGEDLGEDLGSLATIFPPTL